MGANPLSVLKAHYNLDESDNERLAWHLLGCLWDDSAREEARQAIKDANGD